MHKTWQALIKPASPSTDMIRCRATDLKMKDN